MRSKILILALFSLFLTSRAIAQNGPPAGFDPSKMPRIGRITGIIIDKNTKLPLDYATVTLFSFKDSSLAGGSITDEKGHFEITELAPGAYRVKADYIGYQSVTVAPVIITPAEPLKEMGKISIEATGTELDEVEVTAQKEQVINSIDRQVYDVEKNLVAQSGSATDVLQQVPSVTVDIDGNVSLRGGNVTVLIDGKPSGLTGDRSTVLSQIPANTIESIEVITNPSAKYDPEGMGGIINIILKKNKKAGFNGNIGITYGTGHKYSGQLSLNYKNKKVNIYSNYSYRFNRFLRENESVRQNIFSDTSFTYKQSGNSKDYNNNHLLKTGIDYYINDFNTLGISATYSRSKGDEQGTIHNTLLDYLENPSRFYTRDNSDNDHNNSIDLSLDYSKKFKKPTQSLTASLSYSHSPSEDYSVLSERNFEDDDFSIPVGDIYLTDYQDKIRKLDLVNLQSDYTHPWKDGRIETGFKSTLRISDNILNLSETDSMGVTSFLSGLSNHFKYREQIYAVYGTFSHTIKNFGYQLGLRLEETVTQGMLVDSNKVFDKNYFSPFPTVNLSYNLKKDQVLSLGYSRRINRPGTNQLNPAGDYSDPLNIRTGNPYLNPEYVNNLNAGYLKNWENANILVSAFMMQRQDGFMRVRTIDSTSSVSTVTFINLSKGINYGLDISTKFPVTKWWSINTGGTVFQSKVEAKLPDYDYQKKNISWTVKFMSNMRVWKNMDIQISYNVQGPIVIPQGKVNIMQGMDFAIKKDFLKDNKLSVSARVTDVFNTRKFSIDLDDPNFKQSFSFKRESLVGYFSLTYKFGQVDKNSKLNKKGPSQDQPQQQPDIMF